jgi:hypothetical protein
LNGIPVEVTKADNRGELIAKFCFDDAKGFVAPGTVQLTLAGTTEEGESFSGTDTIKVIKIKG